MTHDPFDIVGQDRSKHERDERNKHQRRVETEDIKWLMKGKQGRRIVWGLLEKTGVFRSSFTGNSETFFREGMRNVGLMLLAQINESCPEQYTLMVQEQRDVRTGNGASGGATN
jgi:hypothetical protein